MIITRVIAFVVALFQMLVPFASNCVTGTDKYYTDWSAEKEYKLEDTVTIEKDPDKNFVILNLTDTQLNDSKAFGKGGVLLKNTVRELVKETNPDLITLTGDNAWGYFAYVQLINLMESFNIPWAPVMGNHDNSDEDTAWVSYAFSKAKNCVFSFGPKGMGYGNYIINVTENGKVVESLYMMDSHSNAEFTLPDGSTVSGYDHFWSNQIEWYKWAVNGVKKYGKNENVKSVVFAHIPLAEYKTAYDEAWDTENKCWRDGYEAFGEMNEADQGIFCSPVNNGMFKAMKDLGSTTDFICGHDHINDFSILYQGIRLTYALKTGLGCYWDENLNGGTKISVNSDGKSTLEHVFVKPSYKWNAFEPELWAY